MKIIPPTPPRRSTEGRQQPLRPKIKKATEDKLLLGDVAALIRECPMGLVSQVKIEELAAQIIVIVRERVLQEVQSYARQNLR